MEEDLTNNTKNNTTLQFFFLVSTIVGGTFLGVLGPVQVRLLMIWVLFVTNTVQWVTAADVDYRQRQLASAMGHDVSMDNMMGYRTETAAQNVRAGRHIFRNLQTVLLSEAALVGSMIVLIWITQYSDRQSRLAFLRAIREKQENVRLEREVDPFFDATGIQHLLRRIHGDFDEALHCTALRTLHPVQRHHATEDACFVRRKTRGKQARGECRRLLTTPSPSGS